MDYTISWLQLMSVANDHSVSVNHLVSFLSAVMLLLNNHLVARGKRKLGRVNILVISSSNHDIVLLQNHLLLMHIWTNISHTSMDCLLLDSSIDHHILLFLSIHAQLRIISTS